MISDLFVPTVGNSSTSVREKVFLPFVSDFFQLFQNVSFRVLRFVHIQSWWTNGSDHFRCYWTLSHDLEQCRVQIRRSYGPY